MPMTIKTDPSANEREVKFYCNLLAVAEQRYKDVKVSPVIDRNVGGLLLNTAFTRKLDKLR